MTKRKALVYTPPQPTNLAGITVGENGHTYGTWPVFLTRGIEVRLGTRSGRYGGVMAATETNPFEEQHDGWWESQGWTITDPPIPLVYAP